MKGFYFITLLMIFCFGKSYSQTANMVNSIRLIDLKNGESIEKEIQQHKVFFDYHKGILAIYDSSSNKINVYDTLFIIRQTIDAIISNYSQDSPRIVDFKITPYGEGVSYLIRDGTFYVAEIDERVNYWAGYATSSPEGFCYSGNGLYYAKIWSDHIDDYYATTIQTLPVFIYEVGKIKAQRKKKRFLKKREKERVFDLVSFEGEVLPGRVEFSPSTQYLFLQLAVDRMAILNYGTSKVEEFTLNDTICDFTCLSDSSIMIINKQGLIAKRNIYKGNEIDWSYSCNIDDEVVGFEVISDSSFLVVFKKNIYKLDISMDHISFNNIYSLIGEDMILEYRFVPTENRIAVLLTKPTLK